jgi:hypothetical protein
VTVTPAGALNIKVASNAGLVPGLTIALDAAPYLETAVIASVGSAGLGGTTTLAAASLVNATNVKVTSVNGLGTGETVTIDTGAGLETRIITGPVNTSGAFNGTAGSGGTGVNLDSALTLAHANGVSFVAAAATGLTLTTPLTMAHSGPAAVAFVTPAGSTNIKLTSVANLNPGDTINIDTTSAIETKVIAAVGTAGIAGTGVNLTTPITYLHSGSPAVATIAPAGSNVIKVASVTGFNVGDRINIDTLSALETNYITAVGTAGATGTGLTLATPLAQSHVSGAAVVTVNPLLPVSDASYAGSTSEVPSGMLDGTTTTGGWSNSYSKGASILLPTVSSANAKDWVSVSWPNPQRLSSIVPWFTISSSRVFPSAMTVSYWNGTAWTPVTSQAYTVNTVTNTATPITFDPVSTTAVRLDMTSPQPGTTTGFMQITELQVPSNQVAYNTTASLTDLQVNGATVSGFAPATTSYVAQVGNATPVITATAAANGRLLIVPPQTVPGMATVTVTSEDGFTSKTYSIDVEPAATTTAVAADFDPTQYGRPVTFTATVTAAPTAGTPTGTVRFSIDDISVGTSMSVDGTGHASLTTSALPIGTHTVSAAFTGTGTFLASTSPTINHTVKKRLATTIAVTSDIHPSVYGASVIYTATVTPENASIGAAATGHVQFKVDNVPVGLPVAMSGGSATITLNDLKAGKRAVRALYSGDGNYTSSSSHTYVQQINKATPTGLVTSVPPSPISYGTKPTISVTLTNPAPVGSLAPSTVQFLIDGTPLGGPVTLVGTPTGGTASFTLTWNLPIGNHLIRAKYLGNPDFVAINTAAVPLKVTP